jgi:dolichol kinase
MIRPEGIGATPVGRRAFHLVAASFTTLLALAIPEHAYMTIVGGGALLSLAVDVGRQRVGPINRAYVGIFRSILKPSESTDITGATYLLFAIFFAFYFFGPEIAIPVLMFVAVGDPVAALVGTRCPGPRLWGKSPIGSLAFVVASMAVWAILVAAGFGSWSVAVVVTAVLAAAVELAPFPLDDNLTVPLIAGGFMMLARVAGW